MPSPNIRNAKCVLVVGATAGIGRELALAVHNLPSKPKVIVAGRRVERLDELCKSNERMHGAQVDLTAGHDALKEFTSNIVQEHPELDAVIFSSGIQHLFKLEQPGSIDVDKFETELTTNYTSIVILIKYFLPDFLAKAKAGSPTFLIPITSSLSICPGQWVPFYSASKAALHSLCLSLIVQLKDTGVHVMEILPPLVESELHDHQGTRDRLSKIWMPLDEFTKHAMEGLCRGDSQIPVGDCVEKWNQFEAGKADQMAGAPQIKGH